MIRSSLRRGQGPASYYVTASLLWSAGIIAVTAPSPQVIYARS
jgi:hypothetical protein